MDGVGFLVTGMRANHQGTVEETKETIMYTCCERLKFYLEKKRIQKKFLKMDKGYVEKEGNKST